MVHNCKLRLRLCALREACPALKLTLAASLVVWFALSAIAAPLRVATFRCDVTPWPGETLVWTAKLVEGGYEPSATNVGPGSEALLKNATQALLENTHPAVN